MSRRGQSASRSTEEETRRPPWPDQVTESQYEQADESSIEASEPRALTERASALAETAIDRARRATTELSSFTQRRPLSAVLGAVVVGLALGLLRRRRRS